MTIRIKMETILKTGTTSLVNHCWDVSMTFASQATRNDNMSRDKRGSFDSIAGTRILLQVYWQRRWQDQKEKENKQKKSLVLSTDPAGLQRTLVEQSLDKPVHPSSSLSDDNDV